MDDGCSYAGLQNTDIGLVLPVNCVPSVLLETGQGLKCGPARPSAVPGRIFGLSGCVSLVRAGSGFRSDPEIKRLVQTDVSPICR